MRISRRGLLGMLLGIPAAWAGGLIRPAGVTFKPLGTSPMEAASLEIIAESSWTTAPHTPEHIRIGGDDWWRTGDAK